MIRILFSLLLCSAAIAGHASIIDDDLFGDGTNLGFVDTETGLIWYDMGDFSGLGFNDAQLAAAPGARHATRTELEKLLRDISNDTNVPSSTTEPLRNVVGATGYSIDYWSGAGAGSCILSPAEQVVADTAGLTCFDLYPWYAWIGFVDLGGGNAGFTQAELAANPSGSWIDTHLLYTPESNDAAYQGAGNFMIYGSLPVNAPASTLVLMLGLGAMLLVQLRW